MGLLYWLKEIFILTPLVYFTERFTLNSPLQLFLRQSGLVTNIDLDSDIVANLLRLEAFAFVPSDFEFVLSFFIYAKNIWLVVAILTRAHPPHKLLLPPSAPHHPLHHHQIEILLNIITSVRPLLRILDLKLQGREVAPSVRSVDPVVLQRHVQCLNEWLRVL